jgi:hypothetical protein
MDLSLLTQTLSTPQLKPLSDRCMPNAASSIDVPVVYANEAPERTRGVVVFLVGMLMMLCGPDRLLMIWNGSIKAEYAPRRPAFPSSCSSISQDHFTNKRSP